MAGGVADDVVKAWEAMEAMDVDTRSSAQRPDYVVDTRGTF